MNEPVLSFEERLGLAYLRLKNWKWDELLGEKPPGFDGLPNVTKRNVFGKRKPRAKLLPKLAQFLGCTVDELLADEEKGEQP